MRPPLSHDDLRRILQDRPPHAALPPNTDRGAWDAARARLADAVLAHLIASAEEAAQTAVPPLTASMYLDCLRTGQRESYERPLYQRRSMLARLASDSR
jgi:enoyl-CoA hydratase/carnithine racemase